MRYLGPSNFGLISYVTSITALFTAVVNLGINNILIKRLVQNREKNGELIGSSVLLQVISGFLSFLMVLMIVVILKPGNHLLFIITILHSISLLFAFYNLFDLWFQSNLNSKYVSIAKAISYLIISTYKILLLMYQKPVEWFAFTNTIEAFVLCLLLIYMYYKNGGQKLSFSFETAKSLFHESHHFILSSLLITLYTTVDRVMLGTILSENEVGLYGAAVATAGLWNFISEAIINSMKSVIYSAKKENDDRGFYHQQRVLFSLIFWINFGFGLVTFIFSKLIIQILYGEAYLGATVALMICAWYPMLAYLVAARETWIIANDLHSYVKKFSLFGAVSNIMLNSLLIPSQGIVGAAIATIISQLIVLGSAALFKPVRPVIKCIIDGILLRN